MCVYIQRWTLDLLRSGEKVYKYRETSTNMKKKVTLSIEDKVYNKFQKFCEENAIMLSKRLELDMEKIMKEEERK